MSDAVITVIVILGGIVGFVIAWCIVIAVQEAVRKHYQERKEKLDE